MYLQASSKYREQPTKRFPVLPEVRIRSSPVLQMGQIPRSLRFRLVFRMAVASSVEVWVEVAANFL